MKAEVKKSETFQPIDLCIKIETQEELELLQILFYANSTVPEALERTGRLSEKDATQLSILMTNISSMFSE